MGGKPMADLCPDYEFPSPGRNNQYPWETWLDGKCRKIYLDDIGSISLQEFAHYFRRRAKGEGMKAHVRRTDYNERQREYMAVMVQAYRD
tara:strand:+ start:122 stop:391 length:270 start_codon:yes stop_codon:yes gene_type:complete